MPNTGSRKFPRENWDQRRLGADSCTVSDDDDDDDGYTVKSMAIQSSHWLHSQVNGYTVKSVATQSSQWLHSQISDRVAIGLTV